MNVMSELHACARARKTADVLPLFLHCRFEPPQDIQYGPTDALEDIKKMIDGENVDNLKSEVKKCLTRYVLHKNSSL